MKQRNLFSERNALSKDFQQWKEQRSNHIQSTLREFETKSLFYQFPQPSSSSSSLLKSPYLSTQTKLRNAQNITQTSSKLQCSTLANFRQTIISDSLQQKDHLLNRIGQSPDQGPFVPYINERDKLGRLVKEGNYQAETKQTQDRISQLESREDINVKDERSSQHENQVTLGTPQTPETPSLADDQLEKYQFSRESNRKKSKQHQRGKSSSQLQTLSLLPPPQQKQQRSASTLIEQESLSQQHLKLSDLGWEEEKHKIDSRSRIGSLLLNVDGSNKLHVSSCFQNSNNNDSFFGKTSSFQTTMQGSIHHDSSQTKPKTTSFMFRPKRNSFTQLISWNSQPPSPTRILVSLPTSKQSFTSKQTDDNNNTNDTHTQDISKPSSGLFHFDKNNHLKQIGSDFKNRTFEFNEKHMLSRTKKLQFHQEQQQPPPSKHIKHRGLLKLPESVQQSPFFRVLFNHHKKIQAFNKMIDRNEFVTLQNSREDDKEDIGDTQMNGQVNNVLEKTQNQQKSIVFMTSKKKDKQLNEKQDYVLQASEGTDDGVQPFKNRLFKSVKSKYQKEEEERQMKQNIFKEYDKWYTKQMYYQELDD